MSDMADDFRAMRNVIKEHRAKMLDEADTRGWTKHTTYHYSRMFSGGRMDWWPSGGKAQYQGTVIYGHKAVAAMIAQLLLRETG